VRVVIVARVGVVRTLGPSLKSRRWNVIEYGRRRAIEGEAAAE
jgi:hypothetical protein